MKKKYIFLIIGIVVLVVLIILGIIYFMNRDNYVLHERNTYFIDLEEKEELDIDKYKVYSSYKSLTEDFKVSKIQESDFIDSNYLVIKIDYNPCSDESITPVSYKINGNKIDIGIEYLGVCGLCAPDYLYYALKIDKSITDPTVNIDYKQVNNPKCDPTVAYKPIIYLYPEEKTDVKVLLKNKELLTTTYPKYKDSWYVEANPNGTLIDKETGREYYGLYWEGINNTKIDTKKGFVIKGEESITFLEEKLSELGLTDKEAEEFIIYWLPKLEKNKYNYIYFAQTNEVNEYMPIEITPPPDTLIRILMYYKPLDHKIKVEEQQLEKVSREGSTVIEWGGSIIK